MKHKQIAILIMIATALLTVGCTRKFKMQREALEQPSSWQFHHNDLQSTSKHDGSFSGKLDVIWESSFGTKPSGPLTLAKGFLILPESRKKIRFYESTSGKYRGYLRTKGITGTGVVVKDSLGYYVDGPRRYNLRCINLLKRKEIWKTEVQDATSGMLILGNNLIVTLTRGTILAFDLITGENQWTYSAEERFAAPPSAVENTILQPGDRGVLYRIDSETGDELSAEKLAGPILGAVTAASFVYTIDMNGEIFASGSDQNADGWNSSVKGPVWSSPAVDDHQIYITSNVGEITALDASSGIEVWKYMTGEVLKSSPIVVGKYVIFGTMTGKLFCLDSDSGSEIATRQLKGAISTNPVSDGQFIYFASDEGEILCLGDRGQLADLQSK